MNTIVCTFCDEYTTKGPKQTGYCLNRMKPTWPSEVKKCREEARAWAGDFCWYCCPFTDDNEGYLCDDAGQSVKGILDCPEFQVKLCFALGGECWHRFFYIRDAEVWECNIGMHWGTSHRCKDDETIEWRWHSGWQRYYPGVNYVAD